ncbi:hypothetical protein M9H77_26672 [Catharanthus roseus]|uniref:Uncharacterized protein n=1 Tax=Catharanthus roseus TaxID=4058 RepID=A0ACC0AAP3_CATRO|nr:hypothetical protein M9H77_26672 [Catharanthus roseus]
MEEEHRGKIDGFKKMIQDLVWQLIGDQEQDFKRSKTVLWSSVQIEKTKEACLDGLEASKTKGGAISGPYHRHTFHCIIQGKELLESSNSRVKVRFEVWRIGEAFTSLVDSPLCIQEGFIKRIKRQAWVAFGTVDSTILHPKLSLLLFVMIAIVELNINRAFVAKCPLRSSVRDGEQQRHHCCQEYGKGQEAPPVINPLFVSHPPSPMMERTITDYARPSISGMQSSIARPQIDGENLYEALGRLKELLRKCPHHGLDLGIQIQYFYNGVSFGARQLIDASVGGSTNHKNPNRLAAMIEQKMGNLTSTPAIKTTQPVMFCDFCSGGHPNHECSSMGSPME